MELLKASEHLGSWDAQPALIRMEDELHKVEEGERVLKPLRLHIEERFEKAKSASQGFEVSCRESHALHLSSEFLERLKTAVANELLYRYNSYVSLFRFLTNVMSHASIAPNMSKTISFLVETAFFETTRTMSDKG